jgi:hypothetical protein
MELEELKTIWQQYDLKLNNLEKLNKKLVMETLSKNPNKRLTFLRIQSIYGLIIFPIVIISVFHSYLKIENIDLKFIIGWILTLSVFIFFTWINIKSFMALKKICIGEDPVIESAKKVNYYKSIINTRQKFVWITYPMLCAGVVLIAWKSFIFDSKTILYMTAIFVFALGWGLKKFKSQQHRIDKLEKEILDLKEYQ